MLYLCPCNADNYKGLQIRNFKESATIATMKWLFIMLIETISTLFTLLKPGGVKSVMAENILLKQQLVVLMRTRKRSPAMATSDRFILAFCSLLIDPRRRANASIVVSKATLLSFHKALVKRKYSKLFSDKGSKRRGRPGPSKELIRLVIETKEKNRGYGCPKIASLLSNVLGSIVTEDTVRRILKHYKPPPGPGPSWLTPIGNAPNKLWSLDFFRLESGFLQSFWVMVVMDQYTRKIVGFAAHKGSLNGVAICHMFDRVLVGNQSPKYLSTDNDPLFKFERWSANLRIADIEAVKSVPHSPTSHPFIERKIGSIRREFTDHILFWTKPDLEAKLNCYRDYFNNFRVHEAHQGKTPSEKGGKRTLASIELGAFLWKSVCGSLYQTPITA